MLSPNLQATMLARPGIAHLRFHRRRGMAMRESLFAATIAAVTTLGLCAAARAQENADQQLGTVHFATSCNETAQRRFDRAMRYQHSFWYTESGDIYQQALKADPTCAIAYWGIALSLL